MYKVVKSHLCFTQFLFRKEDERCNSELKLQWLCLISKFQRVHWCGTYHLSVSRATGKKRNWVKKVKDGCKIKKIYVSFFSLVHGKLGKISSETVDTYDTIYRRSEEEERLRRARTSRRAP